MSQQQLGVEQTGFIARHAKIATVIAVVFGATSGIFGSMISAPSMLIGFGRLTLSLPIFAVPVLLNKETRDHLFSLNKADVLWCFVTGAFLFGHFFSWFNAVKLTNIASAVTLAALHPLVVLLVTVFFYKKKVSLKCIIAIVVALLGGAVIAGFDMAALAGGNMKGNILSFLAGMFMGLYFAAGDRARQRIKGTVYVLLVFFSCWLCFCVGMIVTKTPVLGYPLMDYVYIVCLMVVCQLGAHAVLNLCIGHVSALYVSAWESGESVFAIVMALIFLQQIPQTYELVGCIIVVGALLYYNRQTLKENA